MKWGACLLIVVATVGCKKESPAVTKAPEPQPHPESLTDWTTKTELFMEYPPLVAGQTSRFAVHLTRLDNFKPVANGRVEIRLIRDKDKPEVFATGAPSRPGIFGVDVKPSTAGEYRLSVQLESDAINDVHDFGKILNPNFLPSRIG